MKIDKGCTIFDFKTIKFMWVNLLVSLLFFCLLVYNYNLTPLNYFLILTLWCIFLPFTGLFLLKLRIGNWLKKEFEG